MGRSHLPPSTAPRTNGTAPKPAPKAHAAIDVLLLEDNAIGEVFVGSESYLSFPAAEERRSKKWDHSADRQASTAKYFRTLGKTRLSTFDASLWVTLEAFDSTAAIELSLPPELVEGNPDQRKDHPMKAPVIRISIGKFDPPQTAIIQQKLLETKARLETGIRAMNGNIAFYAGIDPLNHAMHNVSIWETIADANQMASFAPMLALASEFTALGVRFDRPILNCNTLWQLDNN